MFQLGLREGEMRSFYFESLAAWIVLLVFACPCVAQETETLDDLAARSELAKTSNNPQAGDAKAAAIRPAGTLTRPKDGVQHPDLDKAWAEYDASVSKVTASIKAATTKQFDAAAAKGDLDTAEKWQATLEKFEKTGELPTEKETKMAVSAAVVEYKKAKEELGTAYESVVKALTMEKKIAEAKAVRGEHTTLDTMASVPKRVLEQPSEKKVPQDPQEFKGAIDLLRGLDMKRQAIRGNWAFDKGLINDGKTGQARFLLSENTPASYKLNMSFQREVAGDVLAIMFPVGRRYVALMIRPNVAGLDTVGGITNRLEHNITTKHGPFVDPGAPERPHEVEVVVKSSPKEKNASVDVRYDGDAVIQWSGDTAALAISPDWDNPPVSGIEVGSFHTQLKIRSFLVSPVK